jgi:hypothetical protein
MESHIETPPEGLWDAVEGAMDRRAGALARRRRVLRWGIGGGATAAAAVVALLLVIGDGGVVSGPGAEDLAPVVAVSVDETPPGEYSLDEEPPRQPFTDTTPRKMNSETLVENPVPVSVGEEPSPQPSAATSPQKGNRETLDESPAPEPIPELTPAPVRQTARPDYDKLLAAENPKPARRKKWNTALHASNMSAVGSMSNSFSNAAMNPQSLYLLNANTMDSAYFGENQAYHSTIREPIYTVIKHRQPITFGVSVGYGLTERWSLTSGLNYTRLGSTFRTSHSQNAGTLEQVLHYIGIPLGANFRVWQTGGLSLYLSAGGEMEKSVSGRVTYGGENNFTLSGNSVSISDRPQWSVNGAVGVGYDFTRTVGIYAEPGLDYHFDNGSAIKNAYKEKPLNLSLSVGLRFSL